MTIDAQGNLIDRPYPKWLQTIGWVLAGVVIVIAYIVLYPLTRPYDWEDKQ